MKSPEASIIIPAFNEEKTILSVIEKTQEVFSRINKPIEIIVINDASTDSTKEICEKATLVHENLKVINNKKNQGKTENIIKAAYLTKSNILAFIDGDYQYDPGDLPEAVRRIEEGYDISTGNRKLRKDSLYRKFMSKGFNLFNYLLFNIQIKDVNCGLKAFRKEIFQNMDLKYLNARWFIDTEMLARAYKDNLKITEFDIRHHPRMEGESKVSGFKLAIETIFYGILLKLSFLFSKK